MADLIQVLANGLTYCTFYDSDKPNYIFANYWSNGPKLKIGGINYKTPEHYYQAQKFLAGSPEHTAILNCETANEARKKAGKAPKNFGVEAAMLNVVRERAKQDKEFRRELLATQNSYILEDTYRGPPGGGQPDATWGGGDDGMGKNLLGITLMKVRNELFFKQNKNHPLVVDPNALRIAARQERREIDQQLGGADKTKGKSLAVINQCIESTVAPISQTQPSQGQTGKSAVHGGLNTPKNKRRPACTQASLLPDMVNHPTYQEVRQLIDKLDSEIKSRWPFPNKDRKEKKLEFWRAVRQEYEENYNKAQKPEVNLQNALNKIINNQYVTGKEKEANYEQVMKGSVSTRTVDLLLKIGDEVNPPPSPKLGQ